MKRYVSCDICGEAWSAQKRPSIIRRCLKRHYGYYVSAPFVLCPRCNTWRNKLKLTYRLILDASETFENIVRELYDKVT